MAVAIAACVLSTPVDAQANRNVDLLANSTPARNRTEYSDVWGYRDAATGKEYALLTSEEGTHVMDCSNPRNPVQRGMIASENTGSSSNIWRDVKTFGQYAYVVSEAYGGLQIIDLRNPDNPRRVKQWGSSMWSNAHNIAMDEGTGLAYVCGTGSGTHVIDVKTDPVNPNRIYRLSSPYIHDLSVRNGRAYVADQNGNRLRIYDVTNLPNSMPQLSQINMPGSGIAHATWPSRDATVCLTANETSGGPVGIYNVVNSRLPRRIATYKANASTSPQAIPHNVYMEDRIAHITYYTEGYRVLDLSNPSSPTEVGYYDTYSGSSSGYNGAWGAYHTMPSGVIYVSDIYTGLYVFKPKATSTRYGTAIAGSAGQAPTIHTFGAAYLGNSRFRINAANLTPQKPGAVFLGASRGSFSIFGITLLVGLTPAPLTFPVMSNNENTCAVPMGIPNQTNLTGAVLNAQFLFLDGASPTDFSTTQGIEFELFAR